MRGRWTTSLVGGVLLLAACGSPTTESPDAAPATTQESAATPTESTATESTASAATGDDETTESSEPADSGNDAAAPPATDAPTSATAAPTTAPPTEVLPDDGCSADNSPTETDVADGPVPMIDVRAASVPNPLPDLAVRRINCAGGWVNLKHEIPAELPLLIWFWAPH